MRKFYRYVRGVFLGAALLGISMNANIPTELFADAPAPQNVEKPAEQKPAEQQNAEKPAEQKPAEQQNAQKPAEQKPAEQQNAEKPAEQKPAEQQNAQKPAEQKPAEQQNAQKPAEQKPAEQQNAEKPAEQKPAEQQNAEKPAEQKPAEQQNAEKPAEQKPAEQQNAEKPAEQKPAEQQNAEKPAEQKPAENAKVWKTVEIKAQPLKINAEASGVVWSPKMSTFTLQPKTWETFRIESVVPHGTKVKKGDVIIKFERDAYQRELQLRTMDNELAEIANKKALLQRKVADITFEITNKLVMRKKEDREYKYSHNKKYDPDITRSSTALKLERAIQNYRNQKAELDQLSKMYEADDLCDATEEIVLQRQKIVVQGAEHDMNLAKAQNIWSHKMILPRFEEELDDEYRKDMAAIEAEVAGLEMTRRSIELERQKADHLHQTVLKKFNDFKEDEKLFEIRAEFDGIVLYGYFENGDWINVTKNISLLQPGKTVTAGTALFTLVDPSALYVELDIAEAQFSKTAAGQKGYYIVNTYPEVEIPLTVTEVDPFVVGPKRRGKANIEVPANVTIHPGIRGKVVLAAIRKTDAIMVPETALERDDEMKRFVYVTDAEGKNPTRRYVKTGFKQDSKVEIREGLEVGTKVVETAAEVE